MRKKSNFNIIYIYLNMESLLNIIAILVAIKPIIELVRYLLVPKKNILFK